MNRITRLIFPVMLLFAVSQFIGCKKHVNPEDYEDLQLCNIKRLVIPRSFYRDTADFFYNAFGNPKAINVTNVATGNPNYVFKYDHAQRLKEFIGVYSNGTFDVWRKYFYGPGGRIVSDSAFTFGSYNGGAYPSDYYYQFVEYFEYDSEGRVSKVTSVYTLPAGTPTTVNTYNYDVNGNLVVPGTVYDDKINYRRTNKIWKFVDRNYSKNNPLVATSYNPVGLPLQFSSPGSYPHYFLHFPTNETRFFYTCVYGPYSLP
jgi:hypothetical protein